ncbi:ribosome-recycling factor [Candidatus Azoamicus ciliaticola]|uniref:Ribosome-recycling factor n=1 Tax=Candidatus Azoamicus ciliaticola TaxID=2652803 RepID=A0A6J5JZE1_9GAMM|nr:ribosome recycling factor [Candidatus Azoamicus ciliaticola]CAB3976459.1 Ribosome-recycling factor [Candidatus Azoamicus ciliaticola]
MLNDFFALMEDKLKKSIELLKIEFSKMVLNKVNFNLVRALFIIYNGDKLFFDDISVMTIESGNILFIKPFEKNHINLMCNEIIKLKMDLNPSVVGDSIKVVFPIVTTDRRQFFLKKVKQISEDTKVSMRNIRKHITQDVKFFLKSNKISEDDEKKFFLRLQKIFDLYIDTIDVMIKKKEKDLLG